MRHDDTSYFDWLCTLAGIDDPPIDGSFWHLAGIMDHMEFYAIVPHDENRAEDGHALRELYFQDTGRAVEETLRPFCSVLEMLVGLSLRIERDITYRAYDDDHTKRWFWEMLENSGLIKFPDHRMTIDNANKAKGVICYILDRTYEPDGSGGFFPLKHAASDQRKLELWYQADAYLAENFDW